MGTFNVKVKLEYKHVRCQLGNCMYCDQSLSCWVGSLSRFFHRFNLWLQPSFIFEDRLQSQICNGMIFGKKIYQIPNFQNGLKGSVDLSISNISSKCGKICLKGCELHRQDESSRVRTKCTWARSFLEDQNWWAVGRYVCSFVHPP